MTDIEAVASSVERLPMWRKIVDFPLTTLVIATALCGALLGGLSWAFSQMPEGIDRNFADRMRDGITILAAFLLYKLVLRRLGENPHDDLPVPGALRGLGAGIAVGFAIMTLAVAAAAMFGNYHITGWGNFSDFAMILMRAGLFAGFVEELVFRGIFFRWIEQLGGSWIALVVTSLLFGLGHLGNEGASYFSSAAIALEAGILLGAAYMYTRSLWFAMGIHASWNVTQGFIWGVPVSGSSVQGMVNAKMTGNTYLSGGEFGLEASVFGLVVATGAGLWMLRMAIRRGNLIPNFWKRRNIAAARTLQTKL